MLTQAEFSDLFTSHQSKLVRTILRKWTDNYAAAEDVASRTWTRAWESRETYDSDKSSPFTWVCKIARTEAHTIRRSHTRSRCGGQDVDYLPEAPQVDIPTDTTDLLASILTSLPEHLRPVAEMLAGGTPKGIIARTLGIHRDTLRVRCGELRQFADAHEIFPASV